MIGCRFTLTQNHLFDHHNNQNKTDQEPVLHIFPILSEITVIHIVYLPLLTIQFNQSLHHKPLIVIIVIFHSADYCDIYSNLFTS